MSQISHFKSRTGSPDCTPAELFNFLSDLRNLKQFVPGKHIEDMKIDRDSCDLNVSSLGRIKLKIEEKEPCNKIIYAGTAFGSTDFSLLIDIKETNKGKAEVELILNAEMNPLLRMMAAKPAEQFLETLINEMERFRGWNDAIA